MVPTSTVSCSDRRCSELAWAPYHVDSPVCGASHQAPLPGCSGQVPYDDARDFCQQAGSRLCTAEELLADSARDTGCNYNTALTWASDRCGTSSSFNVAVYGSSLMDISTQFCLDGSALEGKVLAVSRCCADVAHCLYPTPLPTAVPSALPSSQPTPLPTGEPTGLPTSVPSPEPSKNEFRDCGGNPVPSNWKGDGFCDAGYFDNANGTGVAADLNCSLHDYDGGDCIELQMTYPVLVETSRECTPCFWDNANGTEHVGEYVCPEMPTSWIGDGICDDGDYTWLDGGANLDCQAYAHDGYDCCLRGAQWHASWEGTAPACLTDARGPDFTALEAGVEATCADKHGPPPACWLTNKDNLTCEWLEPIVGHCDESLRAAHKPHRDLRACADTCVFANCTADYAMELVQTYYDMCNGHTPSLPPTPAPSPSPTVTWERKVQCDVKKQQTCVTRSRGDACTDWELECFHVQCPYGVQQNGRGASGECVRESPHVEDHRVFGTPSSFGDFTPNHVDPVDSSTYLM